jgi:hypothetical protein
MRSQRILSVLLLIAASAVISLEGDQPGATYTVDIPNRDCMKYTQWQAPRSYFFGVKIEF